MPMAVVIAIDAGTTGVRAFALGDNGVPLGYSYREFGQYFPQPGWVEHDAGEILAVTQLVLAELVAKLGEVTIVALGITNQRETTVAWSRSTGQPFARAIVWQDRRTADRCADLRAAGHEQRIREITGLVTDPYFSATKMAWLYEHADVPRNSDTAFGTIDTWLLWNLTGGANGGVFATEPSNASRTMLMDLATLEWSEECLELFDVDRSSLPDIRSSSERYGMTQPDCAAGLTVPISGIAGDQQAALFGQGCFEPGMTKNTYGTGSFVLTNLGTVLPDPVPGLLNTVAWKLGDAPAHYAMEGAILSIILVSLIAANPCAHRAGGAGCPNLCAPMGRVSCSGRFALPLPRFSRGVAEPFRPEQRRRCHTVQPTADLAKARQPASPTAHCSQYEQVFV